MKHRLSSLLLAFSLLAALLSGCARTPAASVPSEPGEQLQRFSTIFWDAFDTVTQVIGYCSDEAAFQAQTAALQADLVAYHALYDIYNDYDGINNLKTINDNAGVAPVAVDSRIIDMLSLACEMYDTTNGNMNIALGSVLRLWHDAREVAELNPDEADNFLPDLNALRAAAEHCDIRNVVIDREAGTVYLADPAMSLDVGSVGKGYAVEMACRAAEARGLTRASISVGGNVRTIGTKPGGVPWAIGVENPWEASTLYYDGSSYLVAVELADSALVTSGDYQRFYKVDGVAYHHLIDPKTLYPARYYSGVSVLCADSGLADTLSTGLFCMPLAEGQKLVESLDGVEVLWCTADGQQIMSSGFAAHLRD